MVATRRYKLKTLKSAALLILETLAVCGNLRAVAAGSHAAPSASVTAGVICEHQRARRTLARFYVREVLLADELRERFGYWHKQ
jgi:hypothetical protein